MAEFDKDKSDKEFYQSLFTNRKVSASKHGVPDVVEEIEKMEEAIDQVPWRKFSPEQRVAIAVPALGSIDIIFGVARHQGDIDCSQYASILKQFSFRLFNEVTLTDGPFGGSGMELVKMNVKDVLEDG